MKKAGSRRISWLPLLAIIFLLFATIFLFCHVIINSLTKKKIAADKASLPSQVYGIFFTVRIYIVNIDITQSYFNCNCTEHKNALRHRKFIPIEQEKSEIVSANTNNEFTGIFQYSVETIQGELLSLSNFYGKRAYLIVNVASQWGLTKINYAELQKLHENFR